MIRHVYPGSGFFHPGSGSRIQGYLNEHDVTAVFYYRGFFYRCSSISATQSFDMRVYGRTGPGGFNGPGGAATLGRPTPKPKLDNRYIYMGYIVIGVEDSKQCCGTGTRTVGTVTFCLVEPEP
jgi:hypothetical protein